MKTIAIIGGGAAGLTAAIASARLGASVTIYERCDRLAKKILATGNGRCNMTNINATTRNYHGKHPKFIENTINEFWVRETLDFFSGLGILPKIEESDGKVFPYSYQAASVSDVLRFEAERLNVKMRCDFEISKISKNNKKFIFYSYKNETATSDCVILATGGKASPNLGSNGSGYTLAQSFGHKVTPLFPSLVQLKTENSCAKSLQGIKINGNAQLYSGTNFLAKSYGEILFTDYGLSGPPIFNLSRLASITKKCEVKIDLMPEYTEEEIKSLLLTRTSPGETLESYFTGIFPKKLGQVLLKSCGISPLSRNPKTLLVNEISELSKKIKTWCFPVLGTMSWNNAQVTAGGIDVSDIDPKTMQSKLVGGVYFAGEILDIDGDCGGYNLQWAWSSGYIAGTNAAKAEGDK